MEDLEHDREDVRDDVSAPCLSSAAVAARWGVSSQTVRNMAKAGLIEHLAVGKQFRFTREAIEAYELAQSSKTG